MATAVLLNEQVIVGSFDLTGFATKGNTEESAETLDQTTFGNGS